jgi:phenylacetic acid degradation protein
MPFFSIDGVIPVVHPSAYVHPSAVLIGDVVVGPNCYVGPLASLRGDFCRIEMRAGSNVQDACVLHGFPGHDTLVEEDGHIGHAAILHSCTVRRGALVGINAVVMDDADIGEEAIVAANSFVRAGMRVAARTLVAGTPARPVRVLDGQELAWKQNATRSYQDLTTRSLASLRPTAPLSALEARRARLAVPDVRPLHEMPRGPGPAPPLGRPDAPQATHSPPAPPATDAPDAPPA